MIDLHADHRARGLGPALLRLPIFVLCWAALTLVWGVLFIIGLFVVPASTWAGAYEYQVSPKYRGRRLLQWRSPLVRYFFGNYEDGIDGLRGRTPHDFLLDPKLPQHGWWQRTKSDSRALRIIHWSAWRNTVNGLRFTPLVDFDFQSERLRWVAAGNSEDCSRSLLDRRAHEGRAIGSPFRPRVFWLWCWHGWRSQFWAIATVSRARHARIRLGNKACMPLFRSGIPADHYLIESESWSPLQFSPWRKG